MKGYVYVNPYVKDIKPKEEKSVADTTKLSQEKSSEITGSTKIVTDQAAQILYQDASEKVAGLDITKRSKDKLLFLIRFLGHKTRELKKAELRLFGSNYHADFLNPAIAAGIIVKEGSFYRVGL